MKLTPSGGQTTQGLSRPLLAAAIVAALATGCGEAQQPPADPVLTMSPTTSGATTTTPTPSPTSESETPSMKIQVTIGDQLFGATLTDSPATRDLLAQLPVTVDVG